MRPLWRILRLWRGQSLILDFGLLVTLLSLGAAIALQAAAGVYVAAAALGAALAVPLSLEILGVSRVVLRYLERLITHDGTFRALASLRVWFFRGLARNAAGGLGFRRAGDILARLVNDVEALDGLYLRILAPGICALLLTPVLALVIGREDGVAAILVLALFAVVALILPLSAMRRARAGAMEETATGGALRVAALDTLSGLREVKVFGAEGPMLTAIQAQESRLFAVQRVLAAHGARLQAAAFLAGQAAFLIVLLIHGIAPVAVVIAAFLTIGAFEAVNAMPKAGLLAGRASAAASRVLEAAEAPPRVADPIRPAAVPAAFGLSFDTVHFRWREDGAELLTGLSLEVPAGGWVAVLGPSGAGKSTLAALALKLAAPTAGAIRLGGADIATLAADDVRSRIFWLSQATHLFADTIRHNLLLGRPDADEAALWAALDAAQLGDTVRGLPDRLDSWIGEAGSGLSGGQGRRLALARALLSPAPILILDEPTAGLDAATERAFMTTLNEAAAGRSVLLITHRLTGVEKLDRIWRLHNGALISATR